MDVREYNRYGDKIYPTKLGARMSPTQFMNLLSFIEEINKDYKEMRELKVEQFKYNIGDGLYIAASNQYPAVHIRFYFQNETMPFPLPTKSGLALRYTEWESFVELLDKVKDRINVTEK